MAENVIIPYPMIWAWMYPRFEKDWNGDMYCQFYTSDGYRHDIRCRWNSRLKVWTLRFRGCTWIASRKEDPLG